MKIKVTLEVEVPEPDQTKALGFVKSILCDALGEFQSARTPAKQYVDKRYPDASYNWHREDKVTEVQRRTWVASELHAPATDWDSYTVVPT